jgi:hypothetical protein
VSAPERLTAKLEQLLAAEEQDDSWLTLRFAPSDELLETLERARLRPGTR